MYSELCVHVRIFASELVIDEAKFYTREQLLVFWVFFPDLLCGNHFAVASVLVDLHQLQLL